MTPVLSLFSLVWEIPIWLLDNYSILNNLNYWDTIFSVHEGLDLFQNQEVGVFFQRKPKRVV